MATSPSMSMKSRSRCDLQARGVDVHAGRHAQLAEAPRDERRDAQDLQLRLHDLVRAGPVARPRDAATERHAERDARGPAAVRVARVEVRWRGPRAFVRLGPRAVERTCLERRPRESEREAEAQAAAVGERRRVVPRRARIVVARDAGAAGARGRPRSARRRRSRPRSRATGRGGLRSASSECLPGEPLRHVRDTSVVLGLDGNRDEAVLGDVVATRRLGHVLEQLRRCRSG